MSATGATSSQAWAILKRHARDEIAPLRLQELCRDNDRVSSLVTVHNSTPQNTNNNYNNNNNTHPHMLMVDLSRQRMTLETLNHLLRLARARNLKQECITRLAWGPDNDPNNPIIPKRIRKQERQQQQQFSIFHQQQQQQQSDENDPAGAGGRGGGERTTNSSNPSIVPSYHMALRAPEGAEMLLQDGTNAVTPIHLEWERIQRISDSLRRGQLSGVSGKMIQDIVVVGRGVPLMALRFVYLALCKDEMATMGRRVGMMTDTRRKTHAAASSSSSRQRRLKFVTSVDPVRVAAVVADSDPATTFVFSMALTGKEETMAATALLKSWLLQSLGHGRKVEQVLAKHMSMVTGNERLASLQKPESVFLIPHHSRCEPFSSFTAATLFPLAVVFGWSQVEQFLQGAHDMDTHFVETNPRHNIPVLLALADVWNDSFLYSTGRVVIPFTEAFAAYPGFCAALESQTCGKSSDSKASQAASSQVIDGGLHHAYDRSLYQSTRVQPTEMVMTLDSQVASNAAGLADPEEIHASQDALICSMFAHADELAFGSSATTTDGRSRSFMTLPNFLNLHNSSSNNNPFDPYNNWNALDNVSEGNRPSILVLCSRLDAFACGQFVALAEHRAVVKAHIWEMDPFSKEGGSIMRASRMETLKECLKNLYSSKTDSVIHDDEEEEEEDSNINLSTRTVLRHYATMMRDQRAYTVPNST